MKFFCFLSGVAVLETIYHIVASYFITTAQYRCYRNHFIAAAIDVSMAMRPS